MSVLPLNTGAVEWVEAARGTGPLNRAEQELVTVLCAAFATGPWNIHRDWSTLRSTVENHTSIHASITAPGKMATVNGPALTRLVLAAHDRCCRVSVEAVAPNRLRISLWPRSRKSPTVEQVVEDWRAYTAGRNGGAS